MNNAVDQFQLHSEFITEGSNTIRWIQKDGAVVYDFDVLEKTGSWSNSSVDGELTFSVSFRGNIGTVKFSRNGGKITITTNILEHGKNMLPYIFTVNSISRL